MLANEAYSSFIDFDNVRNYDYTAIDLLHSGLLMGTEGKLQAMQITTLSWFFLDSINSAKSVNWKGSAIFFVVRRTAYLKLGGFSETYTSDDHKVMDLGYRILRSGGVVLYDPALVKQKITHTEAVVKNDAYNDLLFAYRTLHKKAALTLLIYRVLQFTDWGKLFRAWRGVMAVKINGPVFVRGENEWCILTPEKLKTVTMYSAIIPTLNRYDYLPQAIESLLNQTFPPAEIIVFDQTDRVNRNEDIFRKYDPSIVKVIYSDVKGQSNARNKALENTTYDWCLLFDDDSFANPDMVEQHLKVIEHSLYHVSTGISLGPGMTYADLPYEIDFYHLADVLETGNCFMHKKVLADAGYFDKAFDRGPGADNDLGTRIYLKGNGIVFNPKAIRIHYKASSGGLRTFGVWWRLRARVTGPYPPPSQTYTIQKYYPEKFWPYLYLRFYLKAGYRQNFWQLLLLWLFSPFKLIASIRGAKKLRKLHTGENSTGN